MTNETDPHLSEIEQLRARLAEEQALREQRDRDYGQVLAHAQQADSQLANVRRTLAFGLGEALVDARKWRGLIALPRRIMELRRRQQAKRGRLDTATGHQGTTGVAVALRLLEQGRQWVQDDGLASAVQRVKSAKGSKATQKARVIAELAIDAMATDPDGSADALQQAVQLDGTQTRIAVGAIWLHEAGRVTTSAAIVRQLGRATILSRAQRVRVQQILDDADALSAVRPVVATPVETGSSGPAFVVVATARRELSPLAELVRSEALAGASTSVTVVRATLEPDDDRGSAVDGVMMVPDDLLIPRADRIRQLTAAFGAGLPIQSADAPVHLIADDAVMAMAVATWATQAGRALTVELIAPFAAFDVPRDTERAQAERRLLAMLIGGAGRVLCRRADLGAVVDGMATASVTILPPPVLPPQVTDDSRNAMLRAELGLPDDGRFAVAITRLDDDAGLVALIEGLALAGRDDLHLVLCGTGPGLVPLMRLAAQRAVQDRVHCCGMLPAGRIPTLLQVGTVTLIPRNGPEPVGQPGSDHLPSILGSVRPIMATAAAVTGLEVVPATLTTVDGSAAGWAAALQRV